MKKNRKLWILTIVLAITVVLAACSKAADTGTNNQTTAVAADADESSTVETVTKKATKIRVAHTQTYVPYDYVNDQGESDGFEVQVMKAVAELLPQYEFEFIPTSDDDLLIGVESGKYDVGTKGVWYTAERAEKFVFPKNHVAASIIGITFRAENADKITDMDSFAEFSGNLVPIAPQSAQWAVVEDYNKEHPDKPINLVASETFAISDAYVWVLEDRYDAYFDIKLSYENNVVAETGAYHDLADQLAYVPYKAIPTWPLFNKSNQEFADAYDAAIEQLRENGTIEKLSREYFHEDIFQYIQES